MPDVYPPELNDESIRAGIVAHAIRLGKRPSVGTVVGFSARIQTGDKDEILSGDFSNVVSSEKYGVKLSSHRKTLITPYTLSTSNRSRTRRKVKRRSCRLSRTRKSETMNTWNLLLRYAEVARPIILQHFRADCCIASTAITIDVLKALDVSAVPFPCQAMIFNAAFIERTNRLGRWPTREEMLEWTNGSGPWSVGLGYPPNDEEYVGHLAVIADNKYLVDASVDQATRPLYHLFLPPVLLANVSRDFRRSKKGAEFKLRSETGDLIIYQPQPKNRVYLTAPDWVDKSRHTAAVTKILANL